MSRVGNEQVDGRRNLAEQRAPHETTCIQPVLDAEAGRHLTPSYAMDAPAAVRRAHGLS